MKTAVICPKTFMPKMEHLIPEFDTIHFEFLLYDEYEEVADIVKNRQRQFDGLLFSGLISYYVAKDYLDADTLYEILPRYEGEVMSVLLKSSLLGYNVERVSFDTYSRKTVQEALREVGIFKELDEIIGMKEAYDDYQSNRMIYHFHRNAFLDKRADVCVTTHNEVARLLEKDGIPCIKSERTYETVRSAVRRLEQRYLDVHNTPKDIAVLCLKMPEEKSIGNLANYEYQYLVDRMKVMEQVYLFAQQIEAAVVEGSNRNVYLFTTKKVLVEVTKHYTNLLFLEQLKNKIFCRIAVGIGYGSTMFEAKKNALSAIQYSVQYDRSVIFIAYGEGKTAGPIETNKSEAATTLLAEEKLEEISADSGVSMRYLLKIKGMMEAYKKDTFTSKELAEYCGVSVRNMDRVIEKLMSSGYACISGMRNQAETGRPSRILIFYL